MFKMQNKSDEYETIEIELKAKQIDELAAKLQDLKEDKKHIHIQLDKNKELLVHYLKDKLK